MRIPEAMLLANAGDLVELLWPLIVAVLFGIARVVGYLQQQQRKAAAQQRATPPPEFFRDQPPGGAKPAAAAGGNQPTLEETLRREVEQFLRRAQGQAPPPNNNPPRPSQPQRPAAEKRRPTQPQARRVRPPETTPEAPQPTRRLVEAQQPQPIAKLSTPLSQQQAQPTYYPTATGAGVAQHVAEQLRSTQSLAQHAQALGADLAQTDERMEQHLRQKFVHSVGSLAPSVSATADQRAAAASAAQELRKMLVRPGGARQMVIASEILRRPEERW